MRRFFGFASTASPRGRRKLRAYPGFTRTTSPILPRFGTSSRRITWTGIGISSRVGRGVRQKRDRPCPLDGERQRALVAGAIAGDAARDELPALAQEVPERARVLVVDQHLLVGAEAADLPTAHAAAPEATSLAFSAALAAILVLVHVRTSPRPCPRTRPRPRSRPPRARGGGPPVAAAPAARSRPDARNRSGARGPSASDCARSRAAPSTSSGTRRARRTRAAAWRSGTRARARPSPGPGSRSRPDPR